MARTCADATREVGGAFDCPPCDGAVSWKRDGRFYCQAHRDWYVAINPFGGSFERTER